MIEITPPAYVGTNTYLWSFPGYRCYTPGIFNLCSFTLTYYWGYSTKFAINFPFVSNIDTLPFDEYVTITLLFVVFIISISFKF